jgi:hypothetical protein
LENGNFEGLLNVAVISIPGLTLNTNFIQTIPKIGILPISKFFNMGVLINILAGPDIRFIIADILQLNGISPVP